MNKDTNYWFSSLLVHLGSFDVNIIWFIGLVHYTPFRGYSSEPIIPMFEEGLNNE